MKRSAVFFDRDNTLIANDGYLGDPAKVQLIPGAADAIARCRSLGYAIVTVSNQSGVARGMFDEQAVQAVDARMDELLKAANPGAIIDRHESCPFHPEAKVEQYRQDSPLRKPSPGMILAAADALALDLSRSWLIGDAPRDIAAGKAAGCRTILFCDPDLPPSPATESETATPEYAVALLSEAVDYIERNPTPPPAPKPAAPNPATAPRLAIAKPAIGVTPAKAAGTTAAASSASKPSTTQPAAKPALKPAGSPAAKHDLSAASLSKLESLAEQILVELRRRGDFHRDDFSVSKLLAGIVQVLVLACLFLGYIQVRSNVMWLQIYLLVALTLQTMTIALLIMSRQK
jgi:D-glycero-D-manno-heptose 1,7-bisphosphate phosphatase